MAHAAGGSNTAGAAPQYYDPDAPLTRPVTTIQVETFVPREGMTPSLVLADGSHYFGPVAENSRCRIPCGCGIILFQYDGAVKPNWTVAEAAAAASDSSGGGGLTSFFFGRGVPQGGGASQAAATLTALCKRYRQGDRYGGDWVNGTFHGNGVLVTSSFTYHGTWIEGEMQGKGTISYTRKYVDYRPRNTNSSGSGVGEGVSNLLLKGLAYVSPFELVGTAAAPKEYIGDFDAKHYRHGMGLMRYYNGDVYEGEWRDNCRHGRGKLRKVDGEVYDGDWAFDQRHGNGKIMYPNGSLFKGSMEYNQRNGEGIMRFANGDEFFGTFKKDRIDGHGTMRYRNGDVYEGSWRDQLRHGQGKYTLKRTGATMHGEFQSGLIHGEGTVIVPGVSTFVGMFVRGERTIGTMHWHQQSSQQSQAELVNEDATAAAAATAAATLESPESSLVDATLSPGPATPPLPGTSSASATATIGAAIVAGKATTTNYLCYQGQWHGEHMHGRGLLWYTNGDFYAGDFHKSRRHGAGNMRYAAEQAEFSGQYVHGIRHGLGMLQRANKTIQAGRWQQNIFVEGYEGEWDGSVFHGIGRLTMPVDIFLAMRSSSSALKPSELSAMWNDRSNTLSTNASSIAGHEEGRRAAGDGAPQGPTADTSLSGITASRADLSPLFIDFFGLFRNGLRDGLGVLKLPALNGLVGGSLKLSEERKSGGGGGQGDSGGGGTTAHGAGGVKAEKGRRGSGGGGDGNAAAGASRSRYSTVSLASMPSMLIKGRWVRDVLHCDKGVWAFPNGVVYIGRFRNGARDATRACVWWPDGSVLESGWCGDAPSGAGIWYQRNRITPVYQTISPSVLRRSQSLRLPEKGSPSRSIGHAADGGEGASDAADADGNGTSSALARDLFGMSYLLRLIGSGPIGHGFSSAGDGIGGDTHDESDDDQPRRVLVDFGNHFTFSCSWSPYTMNLSTYAAVVLPQIGSQTSPLPGGTPWPQLYHSPSMSAAVGAPRQWAAEAAKGGRGAPPSTAAASPTTAVGSSGAGLQASVPWPVPTAKTMSSCANSLHLSDAPSSVVIGRASGAGVVYFDSGVVLAGEWLGNVPRLATPYRPWSAFDHFITWQTTRAASRNCASTLPRLIAPRLQSCYTSVLVAAPEDVNGEPRRVAGGRLTVASSPLAVNRMGDAAEHAPASVTPPSPPPPSPDARCTLCGKDYSFFRKRVHCTLCLRSTCSSCLGHMDTEGPSQQEDVKALLRHAYLTAEQTVQLSTAAAVKTALTNASGSAARPITFPSFSAEQVDHAFDKKSISTVPVCADCVRAVLWKLRYTQLWIPMSMFASVVEGDKHHRETRRNSGVKAAHHDARNGENKNGVAGGDVDDGASEAANPLSTVAHSQESSRQVSAFGQSLPLSPERPAVPATAFDELEHHQHNGRLPTGNNALHSAASADSSETAAVDEAAHDLLAATQAGSAATEDKPSTPPAASPSSANDSAVAGTSPAPALPPASASSQTPNLSGHPETTRRSCSKILPPTQYIIYSGYTSHTIPHVYGELWWGRQYYYRGGFCAGERHGFGTQYMPNGEWYEGGFERDAWHGEGVYYLDDGSVLLGEFRKGKLHAVHYRGEVEESDACGVRPHGRGIGYGPDGSVYNGEWAHGQRHGTGMLHLADGSSVYSGAFVSDAMEGTGKLVTTSGAYYGDFSQNKQNGKGLLFTADCVVEGSWVQGTSSGFTRIYERVTGEVYETTYSDGNERDDCFTAPVMIDDDAAAECGQCGTAFSFFLRRHHCRLCGDVFCDACTQHRASLPSTVTGDGVPSAKSDPASSSASGVNGQQLRVCDACFFRLSQRRMIALRRYADGSVYAGCWSQGRWVSRGLYCRPDGVFVVMDTYGHALLPLAGIAKEPLKGGASADMKEPEKTSAAQPACGLGVVRRPSRATGLPVSSSILQDAAPAKELLDGVSESSSRKDLDAFLLWWATTRSRCGLHVPLDVSLVMQYQRMPAQMLRGKKATVKAGSDAAAYLAAPARCTLETPHTPSLRPIRLFITLAESRREMQAMVEGELERTSVSAAPAETAAAPAPESRLSIEEKRTMDSDVEAAALRASRFMPVAIPRAPVVPITAATIPVTSAAELPEATTTAHPGSLHPAHQATGADPLHAFGFSAWATRPPPSIDPEDISDESLVEMMQAERRSWSAAAPAAKASAASTIPPLMPPTPAPPTPGLNTTVPWDVWTTRDVPRYAPPPLATVAAEATPAAQPPEEKASGGGEADAAPLPALRSEADMYFACPFWGPTVPDAQVLLEQGKMTQATKLMCRLQRQHDQAVNPQKQEKQGGDSGSSDGDGNGNGEGSGGRGAAANGGGKTRRGSAADDPLNMLQSVQGGVPKASVSSWEAGHLFSSEQRAQCGDGWAPAPLRGPYVFDISAHEKHRSADGQRWYAKVTQREVLKF